MTGLTGWGEHNVNFLPNISARRMEQQAREWLIGFDPQNHRAVSSGVPAGIAAEVGHRAGPVGYLRQSGRTARCRVAGRNAFASESKSPPAWGSSPTSGPRRWPRGMSSMGFGTLKTKAGADMHEDLEMVRGIRDAVGDRLKLRIDPNRAYSPQQAAGTVPAAGTLRPRILRAADSAEPLSDAAWLRRQTRVPIALNESVIDPASVLEILRSRRGGVHSARHAHCRGHPAVRHDRADLRSGRAFPASCTAGTIWGRRRRPCCTSRPLCPAYSLANDTTYYGLEDDIITERFVHRSRHDRRADEAGLGNRRRSRTAGAIQNRLLQSVARKLTKIQAVAAIHPSISFNAKREVRNEGGIDFFPLRLCASARYVLLLQKARSAVIRSCRPTRIAWYDHA